MRHLSFNMVSLKRCLTRATHCCIMRSDVFLKPLCSSIAACKFASKACGDDKKGVLKNFMKPLKASKYKSGDKISIVGAGAVGMGCAIAILAENISNQLCLVDARKDWCEAERLDLEHASMFLNNPQISKCCEASGTKDSRIVVVTAGARPKKGQTRLDVAQTTADIIKTIMPDLVKNSPKAIFIVVSNPADVMTWVAQKVTNLPQERIVSTGCHLESSRLRYFIAERLKIAPSSVNGFVIGEHGGTAVPLWSTVTIGGILLSRLQPKIGYSDDPEKWSDINKKVVNAAFDVINVKGYTNWAIGQTVADVCEAFLEDSGRVLTLSTNVKGFYGFKDDVFMSLPCVCRGGGITGILKVPLNPCETEMLKKSYETLMAAQCSINLKKKSEKDCKK